MCSVDIVGQEVIHIWEVPTQGGGAGAMWSFTHTYPCSISSRGLDRSGQRPVFSHRPRGGHSYHFTCKCLSIVRTVHLVSNIHGNTANVIMARFGKGLSAKLLHDHDWSSLVDKILMWDCQPKLTILWMPNLMIIVSRISLILLGCYSKCWAAACSLPTVL